MGEHRVEGFGVAVRRRGHRGALVALERLAHCVAALGPTQRRVQCAERRRSDRFEEGGAERGVGEVRHGLGSRVRGHGGLGGRRRRGLRLRGRLPSKPLPRPSRELHLLFRHLDLLGLNRRVDAL